MFQIKKIFVGKEESAAERLEKELAEARAQRETLIEAKERAKNAGEEIG